jgi:HEAT repeat protein
MSRYIHSVSTNLAALGKQATSLQLQKFAKGQLQRNGLLHAGMARIVAMLSSTLQSSFTTSKTHDIDCSPEATVRNALRALHAPGSGVREVTALVRLGAISIPGLVEASADAQPRIRGLSCLALGELGIASDTVVGALRRRLDDDYEQVRHTAVRALGQLKTIPEDVAALLDVMRQHDNSLAVRAAAEEVIHARVPVEKPPGELDEQMRSLEDDDPEARHTAIEAIGRIGIRGDVLGPDVIGAITNRLANDDYEPCRVSAAMALWKMRRADAVVLSALTAAISDPLPLVQSIAAQALGNLGPRATPALPALKALAAGSLAPSTAGLLRKAIARIG